MPPTTWYADYMATYIERDVRQLINVHDISAFRRFVRMCAARTAQLLNLSSLAADCGVTHNTAKPWISVLEVKSGKTIAADYLAGLERFSRIAGNATASLVYAGDEGQRRSHAAIFGWRDIETAAKRFLG